ncbi:phage minor head protein [Fusobacterium necrophorum subsp. funduliforme]|uniref:phage minor head protein n=1 Tax=Fusobacterium necrophorum TaxID=859 RepID=UPI00370E61D3
MKKEVQKIKKLKILEKRLSSRNKKRISKVFLEFEKKILKDNGEKYDLKTIVSIDFEWLYKKLKDEMEILYYYTFEETLKGFQNIYKKKLTEKVIKGIRDSFLKKWNQQNAAKQATRMTNTTKKILNRIITNGQEAGISHKEMVSQIRNSVKAMSEQRASTIARTETSKSVNTTSFETSKRIGMKEKCWIHVGGKKMYRQHHKELHGKWVKIDEKYKLKDGIEANYPHEENLPASEVVRCSCLVIFR